MQPWFTVYFFDIGHPCYDQLTPVKIRYPLTSITWPYRGLKFTAHRCHVFWSWPLTKCWFLIGSRAHVRLPCWKQGKIVRKPVNANSELKVNWIITFSSIQMFFAALFCVYICYLPANNMFIFFSCSKLVLQITNGFVYATLSLNRLPRRLLTICKKLFAASE